MLRSPTYKEFEVRLHKHSRTRPVFIMLHGGARWKVLLERDVEVEQTHGNKIGNAWEGIGVQP